MTTLPILQNIARHIELNEEETRYFISLLEYQEVPKKTLLLKEATLQIP